MFLLAVWLFSRSGAILAIFFISEFPLLKREQGRTLPIWTARRTKPKIPGSNIPTAKIPPRDRIKAIDVIIWDEAKHVLSEDV